jgi:hypothetical protein
MRARHLEVACLGFGIQRFIVEYIQPIVYKSCSIGSNGNMPLIGCQLEQNDPRR